MKIGKVLAVSAVSGMMLGAVACGGDKAAAPASDPSTTTSTDSTGAAAAPAGSTAAPVGSAATPGKNGCSGGGKNGCKGAAPAAPPAK